MNEPTIAAAAMPPQTVQCVRLYDSPEPLVPIWPSTLRRCYILAALARKADA